MDTKELKTFLALCDTLNYQKAAEKLCYAPSTLNKHVQVLEHELGTRLFAKVGRQIEITPEGAEFRPHAEKILSDYYRAIESLSSTAQMKDSVHIGGCEMTVSNGLVGMFSAFSEKHPEVRIRMKTSANAQVPAMVRAGETELGVYYSAGWMRLPGLQEQRLFREPVRLMTAAGSPLSSRKNIKYEALSGVNFAFPHDDCPAVRGTMNSLIERGVRPGQVNYLGAVPLVIDKVRQGDTVIAVQYSSTERFSALYGLTTLDLDEDDLWLCARLIYRSYNALKPACKALLRHGALYAREKTERDPEHFRTCENDA